jgi:hypothetical protein
MKKEKRIEMFSDRCNKAWKNINEDNDRVRKASEVKRHG